ncbi:uncharacterized protein LOC6588938 [Drosophila persimilis]|uniref:uncharacterized protein LOC6588938 n=1 Tax=Drosophila persimilis TaxID=7234 RepID=UPI000F08261B|nr:uncharacterized protein LOC6588938 [Drosophila persimilis]
MAAVSISFNGEPAVLLKLGNVYRIGRKKSYEFCVDDESMELFHAVATVYLAGVLRVNALQGKVFVNGLEKINADISQKDAIDGKVKLRFGNVEAEVQVMEPIQHHDSSGIDESGMDTSVDTTIDSDFVSEMQLNYFDENELDDFDLSMILDVGDVLDIGATDMESNDLTQFMDHMETPTATHLEEEDDNQNFIATQLFPIEPNSSEQPSSSKSPEDFIATQPFPSPNQKWLYTAECTADLSNNEGNPDMTATQGLPPRSKQAKNTQENEENIAVENNDTEPKASPSKDAEALDTLIMEMLNEMAKGPPQPPDDPNKPQIKFVEPCIIMDEYHNAKVSRIESVFPHSNKSWRLPKLPEVLRSRKSGSLSPPSTTRGTYPRRFSDESPRVQPAGHRKKIVRFACNSLTAKEAKGSADKERTPELLVKESSVSYKASTSAELDSASQSKVKKRIELETEDQYVPNEPRGQLTYSKTIEKDPKDATEKEIAVGKEKTTSAVGKQRVAGSRKRKISTEDKPKVKPKGSKSETPSTIGMKTRSKAAQEKAKAEQQSKPTVRKCCVRIKRSNKLIS